MGVISPKNGVDLLADFVHSDISPDRTVLFDIDTEIAAARLQRKLDRFEAEEKDFHRRVREGYLTLARNEPERFLVIDSSQPKGRNKRFLKRGVF